MKEREARQARLRSELGKLETQAKVASIDTARLNVNLRERLTDWQGLLHRQTPEARQLLRNLLVGRLIFTPREDANGPILRVRRPEIALGTSHRRSVTEGMVAQRDSNPCSDTAARFCQRIKNFRRVESTSIGRGLKYFAVSGNPARCGSRDPYLQAHLAPRSALGLSAARRISGEPRAHLANRRSDQDSNRLPRTALGLTSCRAR